MTFERSTDYPLIRAILLTSYSRMIDDRAPAPADFKAGPVDGIEYILARSGGELAAVFLLVGAGDTREVHFCFLRAQWGDTERIARGFLAWVWANTECTRLVGKMPAHNRLALRLTKAVGFTVFGVEREALRKNGIFYDRVLLEIARTHRSHQIQCSEISR